MKKNNVLYIVLILLTALALASIAADGGRKFTTTLTGEAEVNTEGVPNQGDLDGIGTATVTLNHGQGEVCWDITVSGVDTIVAAHIHVGEAGVAGGVVVPLSPTSGCTSADRDLIKAIIQNPEVYYVNVHNAAFPAGALRGQLGK